MAPFSVQQKKIKMLNRNFTPKIQDENLFQILAL